MMFHYRFAINNADFFITLAQLPPDKKTLKQIIKILPSMQPEQRENW